MPDSPTDLEVPVVSAAESTPAPVVKAEPTPAEKPISLLDAVTKALEPDAKTGVDAAPPTAENRSSKDGTQTQTPPVEGAEPADLSEEERAKLHPKTQERMRWLTAQRNDLAREIDTYKPKAESNDKLVGYLTRNNISSDEANNSLEVTRLIKAGDYGTALKVLTPIYQEVQKRAGEVLDPDLTEEVRLGTTPHERALELQRLRATTAANTERSRQQEERQRTEGDSAAWNGHVTAVAKAADDWAKAKAGTDPDWDKKTPQVAEIVELDIRRNGFPKTPAEAIQRSEKALAEVNTRWNKFRGNLQEIRPNVGTGRSSTRGDDAPKSALEAVNRALGG